MSTACFTDLILYLFLHQSHSFNYYGVMIIPWYIARQDPFPYYSFTELFLIILPIFALSSGF